MLDACQPGSVTLPKEKLGRALVLEESGRLMVGRSGGLPPITRGGSGAGTQVWSSTFQAEWKLRSCPSWASLSVACSACHVEDQENSAFRPCASGRLKA